MSQAHGPLTSAKQAQRINNNLCIYYEDVNHYAGNYSKANWKTLLCKIVIKNEKSTTVKPTALLKTISPVNLENL